MAYITNGTGYVPATGGSGGGSTPLDPAKFKGFYDASTNTPTLTNGVGNDGDWYQTEVAGNNTPGGIPLAVNQSIYYVLATTLWTAGPIVSNNTDDIIVGINYAPVNNTVAAGQNLSEALGALQYQATQATTTITANQPMTTLGDLIIGGVSGAPTRLAGNTTTTPTYLKSLGDGTNATAETWTQIQYSDIAGTPPSTGSILEYNPLTSYVVGNKVTYGNNIWLCIVNVLGEAPTSSTPEWRQISNVNFTRYVEVDIFIGNDAAANGSYPFQTCNAALTYLRNLGVGGAALIRGFQQVYSEDISISSQNQYLGASGSNQEVGAYQRSITMASGGGHFSCDNIGFINNADSPCLNVVAGSVGYNNFNNCIFSISAPTPTSPAILFSGAWAGDYYFTNSAFAQPITIGGSPASAYKIYITNCIGNNNILSINLTVNVEVHINNCQQVKIVTYTAGKIFINGVQYLSELDVSAAASSNNKLVISNTTMRNPATGTYAIPTGTGAVSCLFSDFDYDRGSYTFAGLISSDDTIAGIPVDSIGGGNIDWIPGNPYVFGEIVTYNSGVWKCTKPSGTTLQTPDNAATDWVLISVFTPPKSALVDSVYGNNNKIGSNLYSTIQAALDAVLNDSVTRINNYRGTYNEIITQTANNQVLSGLINLSYTQNSTAQSLICPSGVSNFQLSNISLFAASGGLALDIQAGNLGGNTFLGVQIGNDTPGSTSIEFEDGWNGSNTFYNSNFNPENNIVINDASSTEAQVVFVNSSGMINLDVNTNGVVKVIGSSEGSALVANDFFTVVGQGLITTSLNGSDYTLREYIPQNDLYGITVSSTGVFVAVGIKGQIVRSTDGTTWNGIVSNVSVTLRDVTVSNTGVFVTVGDAGTILSSADGATWVNRTSGTNFTFRDVAVNSTGLFVAVGAAGLIRTSSDLITWTTRTSGTIEALYAIVANSSDLFVIAGDNGTVLTSPDGITWTAQTTGVTSHFYGITVNNNTGLFVAVGNVGGIITSPDAITWTSRTSAYGGPLYEVVVDSTGLFCISGNSGTIQTSPDGITWTARTSNTTEPLRSITVNSSDLFVSVGHAGVIVTSPNGITWTNINSISTNVLSGITATSTGKFITVGGNGVVLSSTDNGNTWQPQTSGTSNGLFCVAANSSGLLVATGQSGRIISSPDGVNWTIRTSGTTNPLRAIAVNSTGLFMAVGEGSVIRTSPDGITWTNRNYGVAESLRGVAVTSSDLFVVVGFNGLVITSFDGIVWTPQVSGTTNLRAITVSSGGLLVAVGGTGTILTSPDAITWTPRTSGTTNALTGVTVNSSGVFVVVGDGGIVLTSPDGTNWTIQTSPVTNPLAAVAVNNSGAFVAIGSQYTIILSNNATTWNSIYAVTALYYRAVTVNEANGLFVIVGDSGKISTSADGITWTPRTSGTTNALYGVAINYTGLYTAVGASGTILTSPDGTTWTPRTSGTTNSLRAITVNSTGSFVAVGDSGTILTAPTNGVTWTSHTSGTTQVLHGIATTSTDTFVAVGFNGTILTSPDGSTWTPRTSGTTNALYTVFCDDNDLTVAGGYNGVIVSSSDLTTWTVGSTGQTASIIGIQANTSNIFYAVTLNGYVLRADSMNLASWVSNQIAPGLIPLAGIAIYDDYPVTYTPIVNLINYQRGRLILENVYLGTFANNADVGFDNFLSVTDCSMRNPLTGEYTIPTGTGTVECQFLNFDYDRDAYTFAGLGAIENDSISGIPAASIGQGLSAATNAESLAGVSATVASTPANATYMTYASTEKAFVSIYGFTGVDITLPAVAILDNGTASAFKHITIGHRELTFDLNRPAIYAVNGRFSVTSTASSSEISIVPTVGATGVTAVINDINIVNPSSGTHTQVTFAGIINVSSGTPYVRFEITNLLGGYTVGDPDNPSYLTITEL